jgi:hypothetical protein
MRRNTLAILALTLIAAISILNVTTVMSADKSVSVMDANNPILKTKQVVSANNATNDTTERQLVLANWNNFVENFLYQGQINNDTARKNITYDEAMTRSTALLVLNSQALVDGEKIVPGEEYSDFHDYTLNAMRYFNVYLYNMAKLFETRDGVYARSARNALNVSMDYYTKGRNEASFLF